MLQTESVLLSLRNDIAQLRARIESLRAQIRGAPLKFIDLFCGIGGFHLALSSLGAQCVLACDIDPKCRQVYKENFGIEPVPDITKLDANQIPEFDILCGGFPCQAFSHAGAQEGFKDTRGTLFFDVLRILKAKKPKYCLLENVKNLKNHDGGKTWATIYNSLVDAGYKTYASPLVLSPHQIGVPQHRERVFILCVRADCGDLPPPPVFGSGKETDIRTILLSEPSTPGTNLSAAEIKVVDLWDKIVVHFSASGGRLPGFPLWSDDWDSTYALTGLPDWKAKFVSQNREFYQTHRAFLQPWLTAARACSEFSGAKRKFEWQGGALRTGDSLWKMLFQFRPSGIRTKRPTHSPALVAMAQIVAVGEKRRRLCPREVARLQSFPDTFKLHSSPSVCYKQFGNSVNVAVVKTMASFLLERAHEH